MAKPNKDILKLQRQVKTLLDPRKSDAIIMTTVFASHHSRIFNDSGSRDSKGRSLGTYSPPYQKARLNFGESGSAVKLVLTGDMRDDYSFELQRNGFVFGFDNKQGGSPKASEKAEYVEETYGTQIFALSPQELLLAEKTWQNVLNRAFS